MPCSLLSWTSLSWTMRFSANPLKMPSCASVRNRTAVVVAVIVLNDVVAAIRAVVGVAANANPRSRGPGNLEAIDCHVAAVAKLHPVVDIGPRSPNRGDLGAAFVL